MFTKQLFPVSGPHDSRAVPVPNAEGILPAHERFLSPCNVFEQNRMAFAVGIMGWQGCKVLLFLRLCGAFHRSRVSPVSQLSTPAWTKAGRRFCILHTKLLELTIVHINIMIFIMNFTFKIESNFKFLTIFFCFGPSWRNFQ